MKAEQIAADQMMHRVAWRNYRTQETGAGEWMAYMGAAECRVVELNKRWQDRIVHRVESVPISAIVGETMDRVLGLTITVHSRIAREMLHAAGKEEAEASKLRTLTLCTADEAAALRSTCPLELEALVGHLAAGNRVWWQWVEDQLKEMRG